MANETTKAHFALFEQECRRLQKLFLLDTWELEVRHGTDDDAHRDSELDTYLDGRKLTVALARWLGKKPSNANLRAIARHEMIHAVTQPTSRLCRDRWVTPQQADQASHEVLNRLDKLLPR